MELVAVDDHYGTADMLRAVKDRIKGVRACGCGAVGCHTMKGGWMDVGDWEWEGCVGGLDTGGLIYGRAWPCLCLVTPPLHHTTNHHHHHQPPQDFLVLTGDLVLGRPHLREVMELHR